MTNLKATLPKGWIEVEGRAINLHNIDAVCKYGYIHSSGGHVFSFNDKRYKEVMEKIREAQGDE